MPFVLKHAPGTFQQAIDILLSEFRWPFVLIHTNNIEMLLTNAKRTYRYGSTCSDVIKLPQRDSKPEEIGIFLYYIAYIDAVICPGHLKVSIHIIDPISRLEHRTFVTELRSFVGHCTPLRHFMPIFTCVVALLKKKIRKGQMNIFDGLNDNKVIALETIKARLVEPPLLALPRFAKRVYSWHPRMKQPNWMCRGTESTRRYWQTNWSRLVNHAKSALYNTNRESLDVGWAVSLLWLHLEGSRFIVRTDHNTLR